MPAPKLATTPTGASRAGAGGGIADAPLVAVGAGDVVDAPLVAVGAGDVVEAPLVAVGAGDVAEAPADATETTCRSVKSSGLAEGEGDALSRLRLPGRARLAVEPGLVDHVRSRVVAALGPVHRGATTSERETPTTHDPASSDPTTPGPERVVLTRSVVDRALACPAHRAFPVATGHGAMPEPGLVRAALVRALFRQLVTVGSIGDPLADGLEALEADPSGAPLARWVLALPRARRDVLARDIAGHAHQLAAHWCRPTPAWLPRTAVRLRATLGTSGFELAGHVDLAIGEPSPDRASVALVLLRTGDRSPSHGLDRHLAALAYTLSQGVPPFAVATFYSATGMLCVDAVDLAMLDRAADRVAAAARRVIGEHQSDHGATGPEEARCPWCGDLSASVPLSGDDVAGPRGGVEGSIAGLRHGRRSGHATARQAGQVPQPTGRAGGQNGAARPGTAGPVASSSCRSCSRHRRP
jgi:hypothetical protein